MTKFEVVHPSGYQFCLSKIPPNLWVIPADNLLAQKNGIRRCIRIVCMWIEKQIGVKGLPMGSEFCVDLDQEVLIKFKNKPSNPLLAHIFGVFNGVKFKLYTLGVLSIHWIVKYTLLKAYRTPKMLLSFNFKVLLG